MLWSSVEVSQVKPNLLALLCFAFLCFTWEVFFYSPFQSKSEPQSLLPSLHPSFPPTHFLTLYHTGSGIGRAVAILLAREGASGIIVADLDLNAAQKTIDECCQAVATTNNSEQFQTEKERATERFQEKEKAGKAQFRGEGKAKERFRALFVDVTKEDSVVGVFEEAVRIFDGGRVDYCVNSAGVSHSFFWFLFSFETNQEREKRKQDRDRDFPSTTKRKTCVAESIHKLTPNLSLFPIPIRSAPNPPPTSPLSPSPNSNTSST